MRSWPESSTDIPCLSSRCNNGDMGENIKFLPCMSLELYCIVVGLYVEVILFYPIAIKLKGLRSIDSKLLTTKNVNSRKKGIIL